MESDFVFGYGPGIRYTSKAIQDKIKKDSLKIEWFDCFEDEYVDLFEHLEICHKIKNCNKEKQK
jgi:hypothetical protein